MLYHHHHHQQLHQCHYHHHRRDHKHRHHHHQHQHQHQKHLTSHIAFICRDVEITKRIAQPGEKPFDTLKGVGLIKVPIHYVLAYAFNINYRGQWDDMFLKGGYIQVLHLGVNIQPSCYVNHGLWEINNFP